MKLLAALVLSFVMLQQLAAGPGYSLTVTGANGEGESSVVSPSLNLNGDRGFVVIPAPELPWTIEFDFRFDRNVVRVEVSDLSFARLDKDARPVPMEIFEAELLFKLGEQTTILTSELGTLSFVLTPPTEEMEDDEVETPNRSEFSAEERELLEAVFDYRPDAARGTIYNRSGRTIREVHLRVVSTDGKVDRLYKYSVTIEPLTDSTFAVKMTLPRLEEDVEYKFTIDRVFE